MNKLNILLTICFPVVLEFALINSQSFCPPNEVPADCTDICNRCHSAACPLICLPGCQCIPGFTRDSNMNCIPISECPVSGFKNQRFDDNSAKGDEKEKVLNWLKDKEGCPSKTQCRLSCLKRGHPYKDGACIGPGRKHCLCVPCVTEDPDEDGGKLGCPIEAKCNTNCQSRKKSNYKSGICIGPGNITCQCLKTPPDVEPRANDGLADSGGCPNSRFCVVSCKNRGFKAGFCLGSKKEHCICYVVANDDINVSAKVKSGCPDLSKCVASCQDKKFATGYCANEDCKCIQAPKEPITPREMQ